ncbi:MAG: amidohydrolase family protein [Bacteroidales bacterium]|nr:amidohydrolase family protein [Bacteroidales bacterium]
MKIDAHQHFWHYNPVEYNWINNTMKVLQRDFLPSDLEKELMPLGFDGSIAVQARQKIEETEWLLKLASKYPFIKGVVGWVDLCSPEINKQLDAFSQHPKMVGVRHVIHDEDDDLFMARKEFQHGISLLSKYNLTYDILIFPKHLNLTSKLVELFPEQKFVLNHLAKPFIKSQTHTPWNEDISYLAKFPNTYCKLSGMVTEADWNSWNSNEFKYYLDLVFDCFGPDRLMIGSDWPVCTIAGKYSKVMSIVINYLSQFNTETQNKILGENCLKFYFEK